MCLRESDSHSLTGTRRYLTRCRYNTTPEGIVFMLFTDIRREPVSTGSDLESRIYLSFHIFLFFSSNSCANLTCQERTGTKTQLLAHTSHRG